LARMHSSAFAVTKSLSEWRPVISHVPGRSCAFGTAGFVLVFARVEGPFDAAAAEQGEKREKGEWVGEWWGGGVGVVSERARARVAGAPRRDRPRGEELGVRGGRVRGGAGSVGEARGRPDASRVGAGGDDRPDLAKENYGAGNGRRG
jgi:hypothetical protein